MVTGMGHSVKSVSGGKTPKIKSFRLWGRYRLTVVYGNFEDSRGLKLHTRLLKQSAPVLFLCVLKVLASKCVNCFVLILLCIRKYQSDKYVNLDTPTVRFSKKSEK